MEEGRADASQRLPHALLRCADGPRRPGFGIKIARDLPGQPTDLDGIGWGIEETDACGIGFLMNMGYDEVSPGYVGRHTIGGSAMMGLDALNAVGLKAANYADVSGNPVAAKIYRVANVPPSQPNIEGYLFGGFMMANLEQWRHAHALVKVLREILPKKPGFPRVLLLCGNCEGESLESLRTGPADMTAPDGIGRRIEIYGREHVTDTKFIGERLLALYGEYTAEKKHQKAGELLGNQRKIFDDLDRCQQAPFLWDHGVRRRL